MKRLTTDKPSNNTETMLNYAYAKEGEVRLRYANGKEGIRLTEYLSCLAQENGCESATEEKILHGDVCSGCDCEVAILNVLAIQAAELRERLKKYEDAEEQGLLVWLPCKVGDTVYKLCSISGFLNIGDRWDGRVITGDCDRCEWGCCDCYDIAPKLDGRHRNIVHEIKNISLKTIIQIMPHFGKTVFLTREEAEKALEEVK